jgi:hypothetical protein
MPMANSIGKLIMANNRAIVNTRFVINLLVHEDTNQGSRKKTKPLQIVSFEIFRRPGVWP